MKDIKEYLLNETRQSYDEETIADAVKNVFSGVRVPKEYVNDYISGKADKVERSLLFDINAICNNLSYKMLKNEDLYEVIVKCLFKELFRKAHIKSDDDVLSQIWNRYKDQWLERFKECLDERERWMKKCPEYYKSIKD